jgi:phenylalanyl-tRNA synthetase beta chain
LSHEIPKDVTPDYIKQELKIKNMMISLGFNEVISQSFVKEDYLNLNESLDDPQARPIKVINRPSPDTEYLRISHLPNLLEIARKIINERGEKAMLFEIGKVYFKKDTYRERRKLGIMYYENKDQKFPYFKGFIETIFSHLGTNSTKWTGSTSEFKITRDKEVIATGKIIEKIFYVEIDLDKLPHKNDTYQVKLWPKFPPQIEDITFNLLPNTNVDDLINLIKSEDKVEEVDLVDTYKENYTFRVRYQDPDKTLTDDEVRKIRESYLRKIKQKLGISPKN